MKRMAAALLLLCLFLGGCGSWLEGSYSSVTPHKVKTQQQDPGIAQVKSCVQLRSRLETLVESGGETALFSVENFPTEDLEGDTDKVILAVMQEHPVAAYAVSSITYEVGTSGGQKALAVTVAYQRSPEEVRNIQPARDLGQAGELLGAALTQCDPSLVMRIRNYEQVDFSQLVDSFALENPDLVMEVPQVSVSVYPREGADRVVDIRFTYQTGRDALRQMQKYVQPVFSSAALYVSSEEESDGMKYSRLFVFLMERNDYKVMNSITPTYSLLRHGVGDEKAFAVVYAHMCRKAGLECYVVSGTRNGEARFWNIICEDGVYYHVNTLSPDGFVRRTDKHMVGYVWDYSAYPACG